MSDAIFNQMLAEAERVLSELEVSAGGVLAPQVTILQADTGKIYTATNDTDGSICELLVKDGVQYISRMLTMWKNGNLDIPSHKFRKALCEWNRKCLDTDILLTVGGENVIRKMKITLPEIDRETKLNI